MRSNDSFFPLSRIIAAVHMLPSEGSRRPDGQPREKIINHALLHAQIAWDGGVRALYLQNTNELPIAPRATPDTIATMIAAGTAVRKAFPDMALGVTLVEHGATEVLDIAKAIDAQFVRIKTYIGTMVKAEGMQHGCAYEAIHHRYDIKATDIRIFADVYDRLGEPLAPLPLNEACRQAVDFGRADALILSGKTSEQSIRMIDDVRTMRLGVPLILGGGMSFSNLRFFANRADHFLIWAGFVKRGLPDQNGIPVEWDGSLIKAFVEATK
ncbi:MAG: hypothetical protein KA750_04710 [Thermoflexales bacterium]|jgi:membrane complex biogenesis BtpA family protein|nr:hypothetical protein [Thermoflexales bacterium]MBP8242709.1 hypothetical protein [Thermoflexales bacterium]